MKRVIAIIMTLLMGAVSGCSRTQYTQPDLRYVESYKSIPGVTKEEITAVETLKKEKNGFSYGYLLGTEAFKQPDGTYAGFTIELCNLLSGLFEIEFNQICYSEWESLKSDMDSQKLDFSSLSFMDGEYFITEPISERGIKIYTLAETEPLMSESDIDGFKIGFLSETTTADLISNSYPSLSFDIVEAASYDSAVEMLESGMINAFAMTEEKSIQSQTYDFIRSQDFFSLAFHPVYITTENPDLKPVISVISKYLVNGGNDKLFELYNEGKYAYKRNKLYQLFTDEEKNYIEDITGRMAKVNIGIQHDVYPVSFYNKKEKRYEGIVIDILAEIAKLTNIEFDTVTTTVDTTLAEILTKLKSGEISMMTQLLYTDSRKNDYIWSAAPYLTSNYALLSSTGLPNLENYQVYYMKVGTVNRSAHEEMFNRWFPNHQKRIVYDTTFEGFDALEKGEIDLLMLSESMLLTLTNYREKPGFKVNISFDETLDSTLGFSKNEAILRSVVDKAISFIDVGEISNGWLIRSFDYTSQMTRLQAAYLFIFSLVAFIMLVAMIVLFLKNKRLRLNLTERSAKLSGIYSSIPDTVFTKNTGGVYTSCNPSFEKQAGKTEAEIIGKTYAEVFSNRVSNTVSKYRETDKKVIGERSVEIVEESVIFPDGSRRLLETLKAPLIQDGVVVGLLGIGRDITERKHMEAQLQRALSSVQDSVSMLENTINTAQIAFAMSIDNIIIKVNDYSKNYIGMNVGDDIRMFYTEAEQRKEIINGLEKETMISNIIVRLNIANGESHRFLASASSLMYERRRAFIIWAMDIESDEMKNDRIRTMQESVQTILDTLPVPVRIFDIETMEIVYGNNCLLELLGYDSENEIYGMKMMDMLSETQGNGLTTAECVNEVQRSATVKPITFERDYRTKSGKIIETQVITRLIDFNGRPSSIGIMKDLTEEKERAQFLLNAAEREREANQSKSMFLASMSHEIRTPMNAIIGMSELLLNEPLTKRQQSYVNDINSSSHSLLSIINDILDLSKIESGKLELVPINYDFHMFIDNLCSMFKFVSQKKGLDFRFEAEGDIPTYLLGDDVRLRQVITNIIGNAVKFTSEGYVKLKVTYIDESLKLEIEDTGMGIHKEDLPKLFVAFAQADKQKNRNIKGTGLGLSISKAFIEMMNGTINVDSEYGKGTTFTIIIPAIIGDASTVASQNKKEKPEILYAPSARILVVDDNELNLKVAQGLLKMYKINAVTALSGREAIKLVKEQDYDIVFMDHMMPEMDGIETTSEIRKLGGKYKELTIIALTANAVRGAKELFLSNEFNDFISKPIEVKELVSILMEWLPSEIVEVKSEAITPAYVSDEKIGFLDSVKKIKGINTEIGLSRISGMEDMYRETLEVFVNKLLLESEKMEVFLRSRDMHNLAISVHGMKSSLSTIGAMELSEKAFLLETASKNEELDYCDANFPVFFKNLRYLHEQLSAIMPKEEVEEVRSEGDLEHLGEQVQTALVAVNDFDSDLAEEEIKKLLEYDFGEQINELLKKAGSSLYDFDFDAAAVSLNDIIKTLT